MIIAKALNPEHAEALAGDIVKFVRAFDRREPWPYQQDILRQATKTDKDGKFDHRLVVISLPRQNSKSTMSAWIGLWALYCLPDQMVVTVALDFDGAGVIFRDARHIISQSGILFSLVSTFNRNEIILKSGARWLIKSADAVSSRGLRPSVVLYDELGWEPNPDLFQTLSAAQAAQPNPLTVITSTVGPVQAGQLWDLFKLAKAGSPTIKLIYHQDNLSPLIKPEFLENQRAILPAHVYAREHENRWSSGTETFCNLGDWGRATDGPDPRRTHDPGPCFAFLDLGWTHDETALAISKAEGEKTVILALETWQGSQDQPLDFGSVEARIIELAANLNIQQIVIESPQGVAMAQRLDLTGLAAETVHPTSKSQRETWGALYTALKNGSVVLPNDPKLRAQLLSLTIKSSHTGWRVEETDRHLHQDRAMACAGAIKMAEQKPEPFGILITDIPMSNWKSKRRSIWDDPSPAAIGKKNRLYPR